MVSGNISLNNTENADYSQYGADLWVGGVDGENSISIENGTINKTFIDSNGSLQLNNGTINNLYLESNSNFDFISGHSYILCCYNI